MAEKKNPGIIVATHGDFCCELLRSTKMIFGDFERVTPVPLKEGMSPEEYETELRGACAAYENNVIILVDLFSGTPFRVSAMLAQEIKMVLITGVNMSMVIDAIQLRGELSGKELADTLIEYGRESIQDVMAALET